MDYTVLEILQARIPSPGDLPNPGIDPWSTCTAGRFFYQLNPKGFFLDSSVGKETDCNAGDHSSIPWSGNPKNTEVGSLSFLQGIFLTQE